MLIAGVLFFVFVLSAVLTGLMRRVAAGVGFMDVPNDRSSHLVPTPRGGGLAIAISVLLAIALLKLTGHLTSSGIMAIAVGGVAVAAVGLLDDRWGMPKTGRLAVHVLAALGIAAAVGFGFNVQLVGNVEIGGIFASILVVLWIIWSLNLYNFMDGIDGIAAIESVTVAAGAAILMMAASTTPATDWIVVSLIIAFASLGFLVWNWPPAKIFMGDVGSGLLGFWFGALAVLTHAAEVLEIWIWLTLMGVFVVDSSTTLISRLLSGQQVYEAHRTHAYQHAAVRFGSHQIVSLSVGVINVVWLLPLAWISVVNPSLGAVVTFIGWLPLVVIALWLRAGRSV